ncbi:MAG TPA: hypothetical protein DEP37_01145 [Algoriphagus sp.]|nr:hypothetical protein [Algoriphagus sp.]
MKKTSQEKFAELAGQINWNLRETENWDEWFMSVLKFVDACDKWQIHYLVPERTMGKHNLECGQIVSSIPKEVQIKSIQGSTRKDVQWIQQLNIEANCASHVQESSNPYISELRNKINNIGEDKEIVAEYYHCL